MAEPDPKLASRTAWNLEWNRLARLAASRRSAGRATLDLTESNPTRCGFDYDEPAILEALADRRALVYDPEPRGLAEARQAVVEYYAGWMVAVRPEQILLTSGSSEAYGYLFRLLAEPGDNVLAPHPSYPLFEFLSRLNDVELVGYFLSYHEGWEIDFEWLEGAANGRTRALIVVNPNNPTGSLLQPQERGRLIEFCRERGLALICDEVFLDYCFPEASSRAGSLAGATGALTFALNGLSKIAALPQMKLGWIAASGPPALLQDVLARLEVIADTYLSVGTAVQWALPRLLAGRHAIQRQILARAAANLRRLDDRLNQQSLCSRPAVEGGWSVVVRIPSIRPDEECALELLEKDGVLVYPGHFFNFPREGYLVLSLIPPEEVFEEGVAKLLERVEQRVAGVARRPP